MRGRHLTHNQKRDLGVPTEAPKRPEAAPEGKRPFRERGPETNERRRPRPDDRRDFSPEERRPRRERPEGGPQSRDERPRRAAPDRSYDPEMAAKMSGDAPPRRPRPEGREDAPRRPREDRPREDRPRETRSDDTRPRRPRPHPDAAPIAHADTRNHFFVPCPKGLEVELVAELAEIGIDDARPAPGGAAFRGDLELAWKVNLWSRLAVRVLWRVGEGRYRFEDDIYQGALKVDWPNLFEVGRTIAINTVARNSPLKSLNFATLKVKDAVCDRFREVGGERPSVDTRTPDVPLVLYLTDERYTLYVDLSGEPLNRRGFRVEPAAAPLNENLAAGLLRLSGWRPGMHFFDPMMGGGTLLIEAAMMWLNRAPGIKRHFAFEQLRGFDRLVWTRLRKEAEGMAHEAEALPIFGADSDPQMVRAAGLNLKAAGLLECVRLREADFLEVDSPPGPGVIVSNPPYGVRLSVDDMAALYQGMGDALKKRYAGWSAWFITADEAFEKGIGLQRGKVYRLFNGPLDCRFYEYRVVEGSNRERQARQG